MTSRVMCCSIAGILCFALMVLACSDPGDLKHPGQAQAATPDVSKSTPENDIGEISAAAVAALTPDEVRKDSRAALDGDAEAAFRLAVHYQTAELDRRNAEYWLQIAAENGHAQAMTWLASYLLDLRDEQTCRRARFWTKRAQQSLYDAQEIRKLEEEIHSKCGELSWKGAAPEAR